MKQAQIPKLSVVEVDNYAQICTPPPMVRNNAQTIAPPPKGEMRVCINELTEIDVSKILNLDSVDAKLNICV